MGELKKQYEVLYRKAPAWEVGQGGPDHRPGEHYPYDYAGRVTAVRQVGKGPSLKNMSDKKRPVIVLSLTAAEASQLGARKRKIAGGISLPVTWEDRLGAVAPLVPQAFRDALDAEDRETPDEQDHNEVLYDLIHGFIFHRTLELPSAVAHTGTGLYRVKAAPTKHDSLQDGAPVGQVITLATPGLGTDDAYKGGYILNVTETETLAIVSHTDDEVTLEGDLTNWTGDDDLDVYDSWSGWQAANDQLWTDQGAVAFAAEQIIEGYDGTYTGHVALNAFAPVWNHRLEVRAAAGQAGVIITADDTDHTFLSDVTTFITMSDIEFDHFGGSVKTTFRDGVLDGSSYVRCTFKHPGTHYAYHRYVGYGGSHFLDCSFDGKTRPGGDLYEGCRFETGPIARTSGVLDVYLACVFNGVDYGTSFLVPCPLVEFLGCTWYNGNLRVSPRRLIIRNCIFYRDDSGLLFDLYTCAAISSDHNCFYTAGTFGELDDVGKTFAEWQALGYDAHSLNEDPLLTDPAGGDFTLQPGSPCEAVAPPCGVELDFDGNPFRQTRCNMGAHAGTKTHVFG